MTGEGVEDHKVGFQKTHSCCPEREIIEEMWSWLQDTMYF